MSEKPVPDWIKRRERLARELKDRLDQEAAQAGADRKREQQDQKKALQDSKTAQAAANAMIDDVMDRIAEHNLMPDENFALSGWVLAEAVFDDYFYHYKTRGLWLNLSGTLRTYEASWRQAGVHRDMGVAVWDLSLHPGPDSPDRHQVLLLDSTDGVPWLTPKHTVPGLPQRDKGYLLEEALTALCVRHHLM